MRQQELPAIAYLVLAASFSATCFAQSDEAKQKQIQRLEEEWSAAFVRADVPALERILGQEFVLTDASGRVTSKADEIANARTGGLKSNTVGDLAVRIYGTTAVVTGRLTLVLEAEPNERRNYRITDVWVLRDGRWQAVAAHISNLREK